MAASGGAGGAGGRKSNGALLCPTEFVGGGTWPSLLPVLPVQRILVRGEGVLLGVRSQPALVGYYQRGLHHRLPFEKHLR